MTEARLCVKFTTQISMPSLQDGASFFRISLYEAQTIHECVQTRAAMLSSCKTQEVAFRVAPLPLPWGLALTVGPSENRSQLTGLAPRAKQQALLNVLNFLPAMKSEQPGQKCKKLRNNSIYRAH